MRILSFLFSCCLLLAISCSTARPASAGGAPLLKTAPIETAMLKALRWQEANPIYSQDPTDWTNGAYYTGVARAHQATQNPAFLQAIEDMGQRTGWKTWKRYYHADDVAIAYSYLYLANQKPGVADLAPTARWIEDHLNKDHAWKNGDKSVKEEILWWWCDALFMAPPVLVEWARRNNDPSYLGPMHRYFLETYDLLYDQEEHLFARDTRFVWTGGPDDQKGANGKKIFWSRGNGWVIGGLALMLESLPEDYEHRAFYVDLYREMAAKVKAIQPADGMWRVSLLEPEAWPHGETSGTGFYTFALAWGINKGLLDRNEYLPTVTKAWRALTKVQREDGKVTWVQNIGYDPKPASAESWQNFGTGAFLLAGSEVLKLK
ncbi:glycoside hydrolase family 88 protein [Neolewinella lacunae]|uniref:Glycoside hydrolase family 88 protein n=1 Tax=Neolewinella lacunae TaxID=1517758 RepID=A0A923T7L1_9BACT|nr:glycoside hydrolase family 88 protein [Neolewinella lacunae]MBC6994630.1 glycoside hydrolase family 88 protein [Neolewinella lacunae]MDN3634502.1 glycoside hydrolase family 88 protein [Neolewinella lacunae]